MKWEAKDTREAASLRVMGIIDRKVVVKLWLCTLVTRAVLW